MAQARTSAVVKARKVRLRSGHVDGVAGQDHRRGGGGGGGDEARVVQHAPNLPVLGAADEDDASGVGEIAQPTGERDRLQEIHSPPHGIGPRADHLTEDVDARRVDLRDDHLRDRKSTRLNSSHVKISYAVFCLKKKKKHKKSTQNNSNIV